jgi:N-acetylmuramoyl-L-alanine amidase
MAKKVFIGVGHGGSDPGAVAFGREEADLNLAIALACRDELQRHGIEVRMSRTKDEYDPLSDEIKECNAYDPDVALDIHNNAGKGDGAEAYYYTGGGLSKTLATNVIDEIVKIGQNSRGVKPNIINGVKEYFGFIRETVAPACIVETAFVDNATDIKIIDTAAEQIAMGQAIAKGILKTLGVAYKAPTASAAVTAKTVTLAGVNCHRGADSLVMYNSDKGDSTGTNKWGAEVPLNEDSVATSAPVYGVGNMRIPAGGCVLSGHGIYATWLLNYVKKGAKIQLSVSIK